MSLFITSIFSPPVGDRETLIGSNDGYDNRIIENLQFLKNEIGRRYYSHFYWSAGLVESYACI